MIIPLLSWAHRHKHTFGSALSVFVFVSKSIALGSRRQKGTALKPNDETYLDSLSANQIFTVSNWSIF